MAQCCFILKRMRANECCGFIQNYLTPVLGKSWLERRAPLAFTAAQYLLVAFVLSLVEVEQSARVTQRQCVNTFNYTLNSEKRGQLTIFMIIILAAWLLPKRYRKTASVHYIYIAEYDYGLQTK
ncbi:Hypothetical_protein [Hexamita inflata]|uniref:Hypothetical_protein n=1 Tax=Hexamita inflata TaxID=28002 RepID=A0AA86NLL9_9EUKA|nr:Hypothetical protein HINF_LOCUS8996 [Hexamita inflata]